MVFIVRKGTEINGNRRRKQPSCRICCTKFNFCNKLIVNKNAIINNSPTYIGLKSDSAHFHQETLVIISFWQPPIINGRPVRSYRTIGLRTIEISPQSWTTRIGNLKPLVKMYNPDCSLPDLTVRDSTIGNLVPDNRTVFYDFRCN